MKKLSKSKLVGLISASLAPLQANSAISSSELLTSRLTTFDDFPKADILNLSVSDQIAAHRSHSSHRSHASHRSSSGGGGGYSAPSPRTPSTRPAPRPSRPSSSQPLAEPPKPLGSFSAPSSPKIPTKPDELKVLIMRVQIALKYKGYYKSTLDGLMGPATRKAISAYRKVHLLPPNKLIDAPLLNALGILGF